MEEIKIENNPLEKPEIKLEKVSDDEEKKSFPKKFIFLVAAIVIILIVILSYNPLKNYFFPPTGALTISELFLKNLQGELPEDQGYMYNQYSFILFDGLWYTEVQYENKIFRVPLHFGPRDLEDVPMIGQLDERFDKEQVYLAFSPLDSNNYISLALGELSQNLAMVIHRLPIAACDRNETVCEGHPVVNCSDQDKAVIQLVYEEGPKIELRGNCIILKGKEYDLVKAADRLILQWYKIMS